MKALSGLCFVLLLVLAGFMYQGWQQQSAMATHMEELQAQNDVLGAELKASRDEIAFLNNKILAMEKVSIKGMADKANNAFLDGWESLIGIVGKEIETARQNMQQQATPSTPGSKPPAAAPSQASPTPSDQDQT